MKADSKTEKGYKKTIDFVLSTEELEKYRKISFDKFRKTAKVDGFRPGKVPENMLKTKFAAGIEAEAVNEAVNSSYREYIIENNIYPLSEPVIDRIDKKDDTLEFTVIFEVVPEFELKEYSGFTVEQEHKEITDGDVEESVMKLLNTYASDKETDEPVGKGHIVEVSIKAVKDPEEEWQKQTIETGLEGNEKTDEQIIGMKKGDIRTIEVDVDRDHDIMIRVEKVSEKILPELNDEFVKKYDEKIGGVEDLKKKIKEDLEKSTVLRESGEIYDKLAKKIVDAHDNFDVPPSLLNRFLDDMTEQTKKQYGQSITKEMVKNLYGQNTEVSLKWEYIRHKIIKAEKLTVAEEDIKKRIDEIAEESSIPADKVEKYYSPKEKKEMLRDYLLDKTLKDIMISKNTINYVKPAEKPAGEQN